jgi:hypothetical protein
MKFLVIFSIEKFLPLNDHLKIIYTMRFRWFFYGCLNIGLVIGQGEVFDSEPGYIKIIADTTTVPIYINGGLIGHTPLENPIPVYEGIHHVTHHPPSISDPFIQYAKANGVKQIFVLSGDTVMVRLNTHILENRVSRSRKEYHRTNTIGVVLSMLVVFQLWILAN